MKTLLMMRHGKSDWDADFGSDHDRPLNERGVRNSRLMGQVLAVNKGGLELKVGTLSAFLPAGQASLERIENLETLIGQ